METYNNIHINILCYWNCVISKVLSHCDRLKIKFLRNLIFVLEIMTSLNDFHCTYSERKK